MSELLAFATGFASLCFVVAMLMALVRLFIGPSAQDRVLAFDTFYINGMLTLLMQGVRSGSDVYFEVALLIAMFGFLGTTALAKFLLRGEAIGP
jgi:multicomponent K+:H+ antiporter subunit F